MAKEVIKCHDKDEVLINFKGKDAVVSGFNAKILCEHKGAKFISIEKEYKELKLTKGSK